MMKAAPMDARQAVKSILLGGLTAGVLDIAYAMIAAMSAGRSPARPVQAVASGLLGATAFDAGSVSFALGMFLHLSIACSAAAVYFLASTRIALLREKVFPPGAIFGVLVYLVMNFVVLPLSAVPFRLSYPPRVLIVGLLVHIFLVGVPIAYFVQRGWAGGVRPAPRRSVSPGSITL